MANHRSHALDRILGRLEDLDTTNLQILVQRLARERRLLETVFHTIQDGILGIDRQGTIQYANLAGRRFAGIKERDIEETSLWKLMPELARSIDLSLVADEESSLISREIEVSYPEHRHVRISMVPLVDDVLESGQHGYCVVLSDVTEDKISTQEQLENERVNSIVMLAAGVAHELGNPLNSLTIHLQLIRRQLRKIEENTTRQRIEKSVDICGGEVERLDGIITHFLEAIRPHPPDFADTDLSILVEEVLEFQGPELADRGIEVAFDPQTGLPPIRADRNQLKQVFFNIVKNAQEAMEHGGRLRVQLREDGDWVYAFIADTGTGITEEDLSKVFQPYFSTKDQGSGLGMMIVQRILRDHGARIGIDSQSGVGTVITVQFPHKHRRVRMLEST